MPALAGLIPTIGLWRILLWGITLFLTIAACDIGNLTGGRLRIGLGRLNRILRNRIRLLLRLSIPRRYRTDIPPVLRWHLSRARSLVLRHRPGPGTAILRRIRSVRIRHTRHRLTRTRIRRRASGNGTRQRTVYVQWF